jgi:hypothetical protein
MAGAIGSRNGLESQGTPVEATRRLAKKKAVALVATQYPDLGYSRILEALYIGEEPRTRLGPMPFNINLLRCTTKNRP